MAEKKGFFERLGIAWASRSEQSDVQMLIAAPEAQLGYNLGLKLHEFLSNLPDELRMEALNAYPTTPEAQIGFALGEGLANSIGDFKRGVSSVDTRTPDEIDAERQEETPVSAAEESIIAYTNNIVQQVGETTRRRVEAEVKPKTLEELRKEAFGEYQSTGNTDKLLQNLAAIDSAKDIQEQINGAEYSYEQAFYMGNEVGYYGIDSANAIQDYRASAGNENLVPLYNIGLEETFLENVPPERIDDYQLALVKAGFLQGGSFNMGEYDEATREAVKASFHYMNPKAQFGIDTNDLQEVALASGGNNSAFLGFIRDFYLDGLDDIDFEDIDTFNQGPSIIDMPSPENLKQQIDTAVTSITGVTPNDTLYYGVQEWAAGKIRELTEGREQGQRRYRQQAKRAQEDALRRQKLGLPEKTYELDAPLADDEIGDAFNYELTNYIKTQYKDLIDAGQEENAYRNGIASVIAAFSKR